MIHMLIARKQHIPRTIDSNTEDLRGCLPGAGLPCEEPDGDGLLRGDSGERGLMEDLRSFTDFSPPCLLPLPLARSPDTLTMTARASSSASSDLSSSALIASSLLLINASSSSLGCAPATAAPPSPLRPFLSSPSTGAATGLGRFIDSGRGGRVARACDESVPCVGVDRGATEEVPPALLVGVVGATPGATAFALSTSLFTGGTHAAGRGTSYATLAGLEVSESLPAAQRSVQWWMIGRPIERTHEHARTRTRNQAGGFKALVEDQQQKSRAYIE